MFEWRAMYRPDEPRMNRWRALKKLALVIFYIGTLILLASLFGYAYISSIHGAGMPWEVYTYGVTPWVGIMLFCLLLAAYAQHKIIKMEERVRDGANS